MIDLIKGVLLGIVNSEIAASMELDMIVEWIRGLIVDTVKSELFPYILGVALVYHHIIVMQLGYKIGKYKDEKKKKSSKRRRK